jgi:hypothetical protein
VLMKYYLGMIAITAFWAILEVRPKGLGEWAAFVALCLLWPVSFAYAVYCAVRHRRTKP